jgi:hypothetical protein
MRLDAQKCPGFFPPTLSVLFKHPVSDSPHTA